MVEHYVVADIGYCDIIIRGYPTKYEAKCLKKALLEKSDDHPQLKQLIRVTKKPRWIQFFDRDIEMTFRVGVDTR